MLHESPESRWNRFRNRIKYRRNESPVVAMRIDPKPYPGNSDQFFLVQVELPNAQIKPLRNSYVQDVPVVCLAPTSLISRPPDAPALPDRKRAGLINKDASPALYFVDRTYKKKGKCN